MQLRGTLCGARVLDDYAHHPAEIEAVLCTARQITPPTGRVFAVFQPHTYSRTAALFDGFCEALAEADRVFVADIYPARETNTLGMSAEGLTAGIGANAAFVGGFAEIAAALAGEVCDKDTVLVMGAGDIDGIFAKFSPKDFTLLSK
jgi:UDP-N-acetylmuramate--alanine ligase